VGDPRVEEDRRWGLLWVHYEIEELRVHYRTTIPRETARHVVVDLLASGRVPPPPMQALLLVSPPGCRPLLQRFWGTVCRRGESVYLTLFIDDCCLLLPCSLS
jgi:hypothetical protein